MNTCCEKFDPITVAAGDGSTGRAKVICKNCKKYIRNTKSIHFKADEKKRSMMEKINNINKIENLQKLYKEIDFQKNQLDEVSRYINHLLVKKGITPLDEVYIKMIEKIIEV